MQTFYIDHPTRWIAYVDYLFLLASISYIHSMLPYKIHYTWSEDKGA